MSTAPLMSNFQAMVGAVLSGRYRLARFIGEGTVGAVFEADDRSGGGRCAVKMLRPEFAAEQRVLTQFYAQADITADLRHDGIARCLGHARPEEPCPYVVSELVEGAALSSYLKPGLAYDAQTAVPIVRALLEALGEAHRRGIIHRNIKPGNVFLIPRADAPPTVKVLDFGMADVMDAAGGMMSRARSGSFLGSPGYMSPELIRNAREVGPHSDLWSVAVVLYQLLTGREPFHAASEAAKLTQIVSGDPIPVDQGKADLAPWSGFFARALARDVERRFASAEDMDAALATAAASRSRISGSVSVTDMSPMLLPGGARSGAHAQVEVVSAVRTPPVSGPRPTDSPLRAGETPMITPSRGMAVPLWVAIFVAAICLAAGFAAGFVFARL